MAIFVHIFEEMKMRFGLLLIGVFGFSQLFGQEAFFRILGSNYADEAYHMSPTVSGDFLLTGAYERDGFDTAEILVIKVNTDGDTLWSRIYGSQMDTSHTSPADYARHLSGGNMGFDLHEDAEGDILITGMAHLFGQGNGDAYLIKISGTGEFLWSKTYGGAEVDMSYALLAMPDLGFVVAGLTESFGVATRGGYCFRIDEVGDTLWTKTVSDSYIDEYIALVLAENGDIMAAGSTYNGVDESSDFRLTRFSPDGDLIWEKTYGGNLNEFCAHMIKVPNGRFLLVGTTESFGAGGQDIYCVLLDNNGDVLWSRSYGGDDFDGASDVTIADNGDFVLTGFTASDGAENDDLLLFRIDSTGTILWSSAHGGSGYEYGRQVSIDLEGDVFVAGYGNSFDVEVNDWFVDTDLYFLKFSANGDGECLQNEINLVAGECATQQNETQPEFVSGTDVHNQPTITGRTYLLELDACAPIDVNEESSPTDIKIYPNPAEGHVWIELATGHCANCELRIYDAMGKLALNQSLPVVNDVVEVNTSLLESGLHSVQIRCGSQNTVANLIIQ